MRPATVAVVLLVLAAGCLGPAGDPAAETTAAPAPAESREVRVVEVVDGDTVEVRFANGTRETVRLLGVDTPEVHAENDPAEFEGVPDTEDGRACLRRHGERASTFATDRLAGERIDIAFDPFEDRRGGYGRLLAYVSVDGEQFNHDLLAAGHARLFDTRFAERDRYAAAEREARDAGRGLWACAGE